MDLMTVFLIGLAASFFGSFISGGLSAIALPLLIAMGMPPHVAIGTFNVGALGFDIGGLLQYSKNKKVVWSLVGPMCGVALIGGIVGSFLILQISEAVVSRTIGLVVLFLLPVLLFNPRLGIVPKHTSKKMVLAGLVSLLVLSAYSTSIGVGYGLFATTSAMYFLGFTVLEAKATGKLPAFVSALAAVVVFSLHGVIDWSAGAVLVAAMLLGANIGTRYVIKLGDRWLKGILILTVVLLSLKLVSGA